MVARDKALGLQYVGTQLVYVSGLARIVARALDTSAERTGLHLKSGHVIGLPAVERQVEVLQLLEYLLCVNANLSITLLGNLVSFPYQFFFHNGMCFIVFEC